ncbi:MAG: ABC transporter permease [Chloroflexota bacterium]|nr:ABC transporter permease [Chloroflexota bacterium]MDE2883492.1 ABC transporter permease [Chloroflexota bacterium]
MTRPILLALLEVKRFIADRGALAFSIALPIILFALMVGVFGGETSFNATAHVTDLDRGQAASELIERIEQVEGIDVRLYTEERLDDALDRSAVLTGLVIPAGFTAALEDGRPASVQVRRRGSGGDAGQITVSIVRGVADSLASEYELRRALSHLVSEATTPERVEAQTGILLAEALREPPVRVVNRALVEQEEEEDILDRMLPGIIVMFLLFSVTLSAQTLIEERRNGTLERLLTTRLSADELFTGKFLAGVGRGMLQTVVLLVLAFVVLRIAGVSALAQSAVLALVVAAAASAIALVIAAVARTDDQATWAAVFITMFMTVFGGTFFPIASSGVLELLSRFTLNRYAIDAYEGILAETATLGDATFEIAILSGVALVCLIVARLLFRFSSEAK